MVRKPVTQGIKVVGVMRGYAEIPWRNDNTKVNRKVGIAIEGVDQYGCTTQNNIDLDVPYQQFERFKAQAEMLKGELVEAFIGVTAKKGGATGAWLQFYIVPDSDIVPAKALQPVPKKEAS